MIEDHAIQLISNVGFPIAAFLLIYIDLRRVINKQTLAIEKLMDLINRNI